MEISFGGLCITIIIIVSMLCDVIKEYFLRKPKCKLTKEQLDKLYKLLDEDK